MVHLHLLAECAKSVAPYYSGSIEDLRTEYNWRMEEYNSTIKESNITSAKRRAERALSELITAMEWTGYGNEEMRWVSGVLHHSEAMFWVLKEWCKARLEKVDGESERQQQPRVPETEIEMHGIVEAREHKQESGMEKDTKEKDTKEMRTEEMRTEEEKETKEMAIKSQRDVNSQENAPQVTTQVPTQRTTIQEQVLPSVKIQNCRRNATTGNHTPRLDTQERTSQTNDTPETTQANGTPTPTCTRVTETPNPINIRKSTYADSNDSDSNTDNTKRRRRSPRLQSVLDIDTTKNESGD